jgi:hypothetical protein
MCEVGHDFVCGGDEALYMKGLLTHKMPSSVGAKFLMRVRWPSTYTKKFLTVLYLSCKGVRVQTSVG